MKRNSFIEMAKLHNLSGRITYISSHAKQEHLYEVYATEPDRAFWRELAKCSQEEFSKSGTNGKCIEARELMIALPESFVDHDRDALLKRMVDAFREKYGVECFAALHHNKRKTNLHIHMIFAERKRLEQPEEKTASRNMFYDERGRHVRTKKEILDENGEVRKGCRIIKKGEAYERRIFTVKDGRFKQEDFLDEAKVFYTDLINQMVLDDKDRLSIFDRNGPYLATKKVGKNNPKAEEIKADNEMRMEWNRTVDRAIVSGVADTEILELKKTEITDRVKESVAQNGRKPELFGDIVRVAVTLLERLIAKTIRKLLFPAKGRLDGEQPKDVKQSQPERAAEPKQTAEQPKQTAERPPHPKPSIPAAKYPRLKEIEGRLGKQNRAIFEREKKRDKLKKELSECNVSFRYMGVFKGGRRKELQQEIDGVEKQISNMKKRLSAIVREYNFDSVQAFHKELKAAEKEYLAYQAACEKWEKAYGDKAKEPTSMKERLRQKQQEVKEREAGREHPARQKEKGAR